MLGTSDTWSTSHWSQQPSEPAYYSVDCRIYGWQRTTHSVAARTSPSAWPGSPAGGPYVRRAGHATAVEDANNRQCHFAITSCHSKTSSLPSMREKNWEKFQPKLVTANFIFSSLDCDREKHSSKHFSHAFHSLQ